MGIRGQYKNKRDANEKEIFSILRSYGIQVEPMDVPCDAVCAYMGNNYLVEVKNGLQAKLTKSQQKFKDNWSGNFVIISTDEAAHSWAKNVRRCGKIPFAGTIA